MIKSKKNNNKKASKKASVNNDIITAAAALATEETVEQVPVEEPVEQVPVEEPVVEAVVETEAPAPAPAIEEIPVPTPKSLKREKGSGKRGRPAIDRELMRETLINTLRDLYPDEVFFSRKQVANLGLPPSYILYFVKVAKTPIRGLYVLPPSWRKDWAGYSEALKNSLKAILTGSN
jgi:hypothetical protein